MATSPRLRDGGATGGGTPKALASGASLSTATIRPANMGTSDVRYNAQRTITLTPHGAGATDTFKIRAYAKGVDGDIGYTDTAALAYDATAATVQSALRTATGDATLTVACATPNTDPWVVTYVGKRGQLELAVHTLVGGNDIQVTREALTYDDPPSGSGTYPNTALNGIVHDQESSKGIGATVPLGYSVETDGTGQSAGTELLPPTIDGAAGGSGSVTITATEVSSGGTSAVVLYAIRKLELAASATQWVTIDSEDADGDVAISGLDAGDYVLVGHTQTALGRVSRPSAPTYFSVA